jgi:hypothetical protein
MALPQILKLQRYTIHRAPKFTQTLKNNFFKSKSSNFHFISLMSIIERCPIERAASVRQGCQCKTRVNLSIIKKCPGTEVKFSGND